MRYALLLTGYDGNDFVVIERDEQRIAQDELGAAWAAHCEGGFAVTTLAEAESLHVEAAADRAVATTHAHRTGPVLGHAFDSTSDSAGWRACLTAWPTKGRPAGSVPTSL